MLFFRGREEQESRQDRAAEVHALQGDLRGRVGSHVPRSERPFTQHLHARREQIGTVHTFLARQALSFLCPLKALPKKNISNIWQVQFSVDGNFRRIFSDSLFF